MAFKKPQLNLNQTYRQRTNASTNYLNTLLIGARYDVKENAYLAKYEGLTNQYDYPEKDPFSQVDLAYTKLYLKQAYLKYYTSAHIWRKLGNYSNKIRTTLNHNLILKSMENYPHSSVFGSWGVKEGDKVFVNGEENYVVGFEADKTVATVGTPIYSENNQQDQANEIGSPVAGPNPGSDIVATSNTTEDYAGSLFNDVLQDKYKITVEKNGTSPIVLITSSTAGLPTITFNNIYDFTAKDNYTIKIISVAPTVQYVIQSDNNDNSGPFEFPTIGVETALGSKGLKFTRTDAGAFALNATYIISVVPSTAYFKIETDSGLSKSRIFPGFDYEFALDDKNVKASFASTNKQLLIGYYWTIDVKKEVEQVSGTANTTFTGPSDTTYNLVVVQGGTWGNTAVKIISTTTDTNRTVIVDSNRKISVGDYGVEFTFTDNVQGGLVKDDSITIECQASKDAGLKTAILKNSLTTGSVCTIGAASYSGATGDHNTCTSSGTYSETNTGLDLYNNEIYDIVITTAGAYGVAKFIVNTLSGNDDVSVPITIPVTPGTVISIGNYGLKIAFTGTETFGVNQSWRILVSKQNLNVDLCFLEPSVELSKVRQNNNLQNAWDATEEKISVYEDIKLIYDNTALPVIEAMMYVYYRALHKIGSNTVYTLNENLDAYLGTPHIDNPIAMGAEIALANNGNNVSCIYPESDDLVGWSAALDKLEVKQDIYRIVPLTHNSDIIDAVIAHANKMSDRNKFRTAFVCRQIPTQMDIIKEGTATIKVNPVSGEYSLMTSTNVNFTLAKIGDCVEFLNKVYAIKKINTTSEIEIYPPATGAQTVPSNVYIYHMLSVQEKAEMAAYYGRYYHNRRVVSVQPDMFVKNSVNYPGFYIAAAIANMKAKLVPHQPITNYDLEFVEGIPNIYNEDQLDIIANGGNLIVTQDTDVSKPYIRHQVTSNPDDIRYRELSMVENYDRISYGIIEVLKPYIGKYNIHTGVLNTIKAGIENYLYSLTANTTESAGSAVTGYTLVKLEQNSTQEDKIDIEVQLELPYPINYIDIILSV